MRPAGARVVSLAKDRAVRVHDDAADHGIGGRSAAAALGERDRPVHDPRGVHASCPGRTSGGRQRPTRTPTAPNTPPSYTPTSTVARARRSARSIPAYAFWWTLEASVEPFVAPSAVGIR